MTLAELLALAKEGALPACADCPWSPRTEPLVGFGISCDEHGIRWQSAVIANSMLVFQDPADTTPHETGRLCAVHNANNPSDKTAQQILALWNATVSLATDNPAEGGYLKAHYWTNSIMHGASESTGLRSPLVMSRARQHCQNVLREQITLLRPRVLIATGKEAFDSLFKLGLAPKDWSKARLEFPNGAYHYRNERWLSGSPIHICSTYHTAAKVVNQTLSRSYDESCTEKSIQEKADGLPNPPSIRHFLERHGDPVNRATDRGMRYLLNHWIDIGIKIREGHRDAI